MLMLMDAGEEILLKRFLKNCCHQKHLILYTILILRPKPCTYANICKLKMSDALISCHMQDFG